MRQFLAELKAFAIQMAECVDQQGARVRFKPSHVFNTKDYGGLALSGEEASRYSSIIDGLSEHLSDAMSKSSIKKLVQIAILKTLDLNKRNQSQSLVSRADQAVNEVHDALTSPQLKWVSCMPIIGITPPKRPWRFNDVILVDIRHKDGRALLEAADRITDQSADPDELKTKLKAEARKELVEDHPEQAFALVNTSALDPDAAWSSAKRRLRFTLDCLNLAVDFLHSNNFHALSMQEPPRRHYSSGLTVNVTDYKLAWRPSEVTAPVGILDAEELRAGMRKHSALRTLCKYLQDDRPTPHQARVLSAAHWAGRAVGEWRAEEAFLFRAIALESLILGGGDNPELTTRLTLSTVHLLGDMLASRKWGVQSLKKLYGVRSKIVHSGRYEVDEADSALLRGFVIRSFARVLSDRAFLRMVGKSELDEWFAERMRGEPRRGPA